MIITDADLDEPGPRIVYVNEALCRMTGYSRDEMIGKTPRMFQGPATSRETMNHLKRTLQQGKLFQARAANYRKYGQHYWVEWFIVPITDQTGMKYYFSAQQDISVDMSKLDIIFREQTLAAAASQLLRASVDLNNIIYELSGDVSRDPNASADLRQKVLSHTRDAMTACNNVVRMLK